MHGGSLGRNFRAPVFGVVVLVVVGFALLGAISLRPLIGGLPVPPGPVSATSVQGPFELTIRSAKGQYAPSEPITVNASLTYGGPEASLDISHAGGVEAPPTPIRFGIEEPVMGNLVLSPASDLACGGSTLRRDSPDVFAFTKSGAFTGEDPFASAYQALFNDPVLRLPAGTWHIYAVANFGIGNGCGNDTVKLSATITIVIPDAGGAVPTHPAATRPPDPLDLPVGDDTQDGAIQLTLTSPHGRYKAGDPIDVTAGLTNGGSGGSITTYGGPDGPVIFSVRQVDGPVIIEPIVLQSCIEQVTLPAYQPMQIPFKKSGTVAGGAADPEYWQAWFADPILRLPAGKWEISATPNFVLGGCGSRSSPNLRPTITLVVTP
ncbi:MAG TPA: hypothetical protein VGQ85_02535 [Candidatus Limnocylindrales bacterium]|nr:hypothetical protein [Candidatus Limnocylindrales bacterium]